MDMKSEFVNLAGAIFTRDINSFFSVLLCLSGMKFTGEIEIEGRNLITFLLQGEKEKFSLRKNSI